MYIIRKRDQILKREKGPSICNGKWDQVADMGNGIKWISMEKGLSIRNGKWDQLSPIGKGTKCLMGKGIMCLSLEKRTMCVSREKGLSGCHGKMDHPCFPHRNVYI